MPNSAYQRLRRRERRIEPRHRLHHPTITSHPINQLAAERHPRTGSRPDSNNSNGAASTVPDKPRPAACRPHQTPGTSPGAPVRYCVEYDADFAADEA
jgi:hypothetical protein